VTFHISSNQSAASFDCHSNGTYQLLKQMSPLPFANIGEFHNFSIHYFPTTLSFYANDTLLGSFNATSVTNGIMPSGPMALWLYITADSTAPHVTDAMYIRSASYILGIDPLPKN
jgi:hypothetical protein